jgi:hypothetical protein
MEYFLSKGMKTIVRRRKITCFCFCWLGISIAPSTCTDVKSALLRGKDILHQMASNGKYGKEMNEGSIGECSIQQWKSQADCGFSWASPRFDGFLAPLVRFERTTVGLEVRRSIH